MKKQANSEVVITTVKGLLQAIVIQDQLEKIGVPATLKYNTHEYSSGTRINSSDEVQVLVPAEKAQEVTNLLNATPRMGEIFNVKQYAH